MPRKVPAVPAEVFERSPHHFEFELDRAILSQVCESLENSPVVPLLNNCAPPEAGVYVLYWKSELVYIGKASKEGTKSKRTLRARLNEHVAKIGSRQNLKLSQMTCRFLTIESDWFTWAAEFALMNHFNPSWNNSGFGSKVPGKGRPGTSRVSPWDQQFPLAKR